MKMKIAVFIGIVLLCLAGWGFFLYNKPHQGIGDTASDLSVTATELYSRYSAGEAAANAQFLNKVLSVTGVVGEVSKGDNGDVVLLKSGSDMGGVSCSLFDKSTPAPPVGSTLTIKGKCTGFLMDVALVDCVIEHHQ